MCPGAGHKKQDRRGRPDGGEKSVKRLTSGLDLGLSRIESVCVVVFMAVALVLGTMQVVLRYAFNTGFHWSEAFFTLFTVAGMMAAGSRAVRDDKHVRVELLPMILPAFWTRRMLLVADCFALALVAYFTYCGIRYVQFLQEMETVSLETGLPDWIVYTIVPVVMGAFSVRYLLRIVATLTGERVVVHVKPGANELGERP